MKSFGSATGVESTVLSANTNQLAQLVHFWEFGEVAKIQTAAGIECYF